MMDRMISLLAAFVGLIALGGAILVHTHGQTEDQQMATEIAALQASLAAAQSAGTVASPPPPSSATSSSDKDTADALLGLQGRIAALEQTTRAQADQLEQARAELAARPAAETSVEVANAEPAASSPAPAAIVADGPTTECIPLGTRFMAAAGDSFLICKTKAVVKVVAVDDGEAVLDGVGTLIAGGSATPLDVKGCSVTVFSADTSGYAELRVSCS
jgi:hypothetical protein